MRPLTLAEIAAATGGRLVGPPDLVTTGVSTDTRSLPPGALFVALRGERHDGHDYAAAARDRGAAALLAEREVPGVDLPSVQVSDSLVAYGDLARYYRSLFSLPTVGITGSVGKTTTKEMVAHVLGAAFRVLKNEANYNNEIGVPQTLFGLEERHTALVLEMGMRGSGQIARLAEIGQPSIAVITNIGFSHIELLGSREGIAAAKAELLEALPVDGAAVIPAADPYRDALRSRFSGETLTCAVEGAGDVVASDLTRHERGWRFTVDSPWGRAKMFLHSPGRFNVQNALFAVAVAGRLGVPLETISRSLNTWTAPAMRLEVLHAPNGVTIVSDAYNAAPDSVCGALETLRDTPAAGRRIAVLGEMRELGAYSAEGHAMVGRMAAAVAPALLALVGPLTAHVAEAAVAAGYPADAIHSFADTDEAAASIGGLVRPGDTLLVKGSRALALEKVVAALGADGGVAHG